jgi:hypothetical protein
LPCSGRRGSDFDLSREIDSIYGFEKAVHEMLARPLAVSDDVDAAILLELQGEQRRVALGVLECGAGEAPGRPQPVRLSEPSGFRQASGDGGGK